MDTTTPEPTPTGTEAKVCADIARRQQFGLNKYSTTVADNPLSLAQWLEHGYLECLDMAIYLRRSMELAKEFEELKAELENIKTTLKDPFAVYANMLHGNIAPLPHHLWLHVAGLTCPPGFVPLDKAHA